VNREQNFPGVFYDVLYIISSFFKVIECPDSLEKLATVGIQMFHCESPVFYSGTGDLINSLAVLQ